MNPIARFLKSWMPARFFLLLALIVITACEEDYMTINAFEAEGTTIDYHLPDTTATLEVAVVSLTCSKNKDKNLEKVFQTIESVMQTNPEVELIAFGESLTGWYAGSADYIRQIAEPIPGPFTDSLAHFAKEYAIYLSIGLAEKSGDLLYNSMVALNPEGEIAGMHRKNTLTPEDKNAGYTGVQNANIIQIKDFKSGLMICADVNGAWLTKQYTDAEIDIILSAFASPIGLPSFNLISRRMNAWQIFPNRYGKENGSDYSGLIYVSDPVGNIARHKINKETYLTYTIVK